MINKKTRFDDPKEYEGFYDIEDIGNEKYKLSLTVTGVSQEQINNG
jgi:HSP20 family molecular chaperone IbpA